MKRKSK